MIRNRDQIGFVTIVEKQDRHRRTIELQSQIKAKIVFTVSVATSEKTMLEDQRINNRSLRIGKAIGHAHHAILEYSFGLTVLHLFHGQ